MLDQGVGVGFTPKVRLPAGTYKNLFRTEETSVAETTALAQKLYAPGIGIAAEFDFDIADDEVKQSGKLASLTLNGKPVKQLVPTS
ncbi:MAG: hypothetical protein H7Y01_09775, partial [Ferruginibacter sp.]|nr:hypothetical protein [Chitinophagaceae bacterium]